MSVENSLPFERQEAYEWPLAVYLLLGGIGGAFISLSFILHYLFSWSPVGNYGMLIGMGLFALAGLTLLFLDLERPLNAIYSLNNIKTSGISWDVVLIALSFGGALLYVLPFYVSIPVLESLRLLFGGIGALAGFLFPVISGGLISAPVSVPLWHTPLLPVLFLINSFGVAFAAIPALFAPGSEILAFIFNLAVFMANLVISGGFIAFYEHAHNGPVEAWYGFQEMWKKFNFQVGFLVVGLLFPLILSGYMFFTGNFLSWGFGALAVAQLIGGFALRNCLLKHGYHTYPWPY
ncbi:NrfD/PsrC family molybdoenzyme membrane anchor subunit [Carboxydothermus hydrogenoformans]|uniref:Putative molybdopterin oxidoreductase, membrane subunit n=1 Tax=Carboxydothermus hydrogenoformans (strain ATCC BAA-161 / DSM 6008 / Z-2901) TaxID=246194 RepID=Q3AEU8_CARHZ|nr:NrfD/PsrC family molybdoenzyme membrane anchor subunit [Carboxydothermus hydrogenoformans]ABB13682.1 putative molybdopterin oxidoreductase, membrane subunit [Carboxydothermus hydrogenoformans Z-2901]